MTLSVNPKKTSKPKKEKVPRDYHSKGGRRPLGETNKVRFPVSRVAEKTVTTVRFFGPTYPGGMPGFVEDAISMYAHMLDLSGKTTPIMWPTKVPSDK